MPLSKTQIALYLTLAVGVFVGLAYGLPRWQLLAFAAVIGIADVVTDRKKPPSDMPDVWPWQRPPFWIVLAGLTLLAIAFTYQDVPVGITVLICALGLAFYGYEVARQIEFKRRTMRGTTRGASGVEDWTLLGACLVFCLGSLVLARQDWRTAVVTITFFGACGLVFWGIIRRRRRERRSIGAIVRVSGGVNIYVDRPRMGFIALGCCIVGSVLYFVGTNYPLLFRLIGAFIALVGIGVAIAIAFGRYARQFIRFDPDAFVVGDGRMSYRIAWDNVANVLGLEFANNPFIGMELRDPARVVVEPANQVGRFQRLLAENRALFGTDIVIAPANFGVDGPVLGGALQRYAFDQGARTELVRRDWLAAPRS